jgi:hypothetical protein
VRLEELETRDVVVLFHRQLAGDVLRLGQGEGGVIRAADELAGIVRAERSEDLRAVIVLVRPVSRLGARVRIVVDEVVLRDHLDLVPGLVERHVIPAEAGVEHTDDHALSGVTGLVQGDEVDLGQLGRRAAVVQHPRPGGDLRRPRLEELRTPRVRHGLDPDHRRQRRDRVDLRRRGHGAHRVDPAAADPHAGARARDQIDVGLVHRQVTKVE